MKEKGSVGYDKSRSRYYIAWYYAPLGKTLKIWRDGDVGFYESDEGKKLAEAMLQRMRQEVKDGTFRLEHYKPASSFDVDEHRETLRRIYYAMKRRCYKESCSDSKYYKDRGITICDEWLNDIDTFLLWAVTSGYHPGLSIHKKDNNGGYSPDNCVWLSPAEHKKRHAIDTIQHINGDGIRAKVSRLIVDRRFNAFAASKQPHVFKPDSYYVDQIMTLFEKHDRTKAHERRNHG